MPDKIKQIPGRILELWKKYSKKQRVIIISVVGIVILTLLLLILLLGRTQYTSLATFKDVGTAKAAVDSLKESGIAYRVADDNVTVLVDANKKSEAVFLLAGGEFSKQDGFTIEDLLKTDMSTTSSDKKLMKDLYMQSNLENTIKQQVGIDECYVLYFPKETTYSVLETQQDIGCTIYLTTNSEFKKSMAETIAVAAAAALGNNTTERIKVVDQNNDLLYNGPEDETSGTSVKSIEYRSMFTNLLKNQVESFALMNGFTDVEVAMSLDLDFSQTEELMEEYIAAEGQEQGLMQTYEKISTENKGTTGDVPGTDSNDETDYFIQQSGGGASSSDEERMTYLPSKKTTKIVSEWGLFNRDNSSMSIVLQRVVSRTEDDLNKLGLLTGTTFDEYVLNNSEPKQITITDEVRTAFSNASGIQADKLSIIAYEIYIYLPTEKVATNWDLYLKIVLFALILGMLIFVIFRGMKPVEVTETEPELSIEEMLATTKENQSLDDIEFSDKSETRRMIEKFVDENPEAVANLLRNWLDDGWS